jgi:hypothetical protein
LAKKKKLITADEIVVVTGNDLSCVYYKPHQALKLGLQMEELPLINMKLNQ